jgi:hypothetical protein
MYAICYEESDYDHHVCDPFLYVETEKEAIELCNILRSQNTLKSGEKVRQWLRDNVPQYDAWLDANANDNPYFDLWEMSEDETTEERVAKRAETIANGCKACGIIDSARFGRMLNYHKLEMDYMQGKNSDYTYYELKKYPG